ncbi:hypothetical protein O4H66_28385 [Comamonadaceae bacterium G21597-S1]|nr:hypothetical protein [Comamonadaceae bacterium G21597-S1]
MSSSSAQDLSVAVNPNQEITKLEITTSAELRKVGIENGSKGVKGAFFLYAFVFVVNGAYAHFNNDSRLLDKAELIWLAGVLCLALLAYFGFIFKYTVAAKLDNGNLTFGTGSSAQRPGDAA